MSVSTIDIGGLESLIRKEVFEGEALGEVEERLEKLQTAAKDNRAKYEARILHEAANVAKKGKCKQINFFPDFLYLYTEKKSREDLKKSLDP